MSTQLAAIPIQSSLCFTLVVASEISLRKLLAGHLHYLSNLSSSSEFYHSLSSTDNSSTPIFKCPQKPLSLLQITSPARMSLFFCISFETWPIQQNNMWSEKG